MAQMTAVQSSRSALYLEDGRFQDSLFNDIAAPCMRENAEVNRLGAR